jgi:thiamine-phosphate pyrophosphorylase
MLVGDARNVARDLGERCRSHAVDLVWLRDRHLDVAQLRQTLQRMRTEIRIPIVVSLDPVDAHSAGADGVQLRDDEHRPTLAHEARKLGLLVGGSAHSPESIRELVQVQADWIVFGPVHDTQKPHGLQRGRGYEVLRQAVNLARPVPVIAIGGLELGDLADVLATGAKGLAAIRAFERPAR